MEAVYLVSDSGRMCVCDCAGCCIRWVMGRERSWRNLDCTLSHVLSGEIGFKKTGPRFYPNCKTGETCGVFTALEVLIIYVWSHEPLYYEKLISSLITSNIQIFNSSSMTSGINFINRFCWCKNYALGSTEYALYIAKNWGHGSGANHEFELSNDAGTGCLLFNWPRASKSFMFIQVRSCPQFQLWLHFYPVDLRMRRHDDEKCLQLFSFWRYLGT